MPGFFALKPRILLSLILALAMHGAILTFFRVEPRVQPGGSTVHAVSTRQLPPADRTLVATAEGPSEWAVSQPPVALVPPPETPKQRDPAPTDTVTAPSLAVPAAAPGDGLDDYIPRAQLTAGPSPVVPIVVPFPDEMTQQGRFIVVLALFIDEMGVVRKIRIDGPPVAPALEQVAREAFGAARFRPGERDGQPVRSTIRIEVTFDNSPIRE